MSSQEYNKKTGLLICCPISTRIRGHLTEVSVNGLEKPSVVASSIIQMLSWQERKAKFVKKVTPEVFEAVLHRLLPLIGLTSFWSMNKPSIYPVIFALLEIF